MSQLLLADWPTYRPMLFPILEQTEQNNDHKFAKEVDQALQSSRAFLFLAPDGFVVLEPMALADGMTAFIQFGWCSRANALARYQEELEQIARAGNAVQMMLETKVTKLAIPLTKQGWRCVEARDGITRWVKPLHGGDR
ncbi:MAG: hypothetical protein WCF45_10595 [Photobacterium halotolerans]